VKRDLEALRAAAMEAGAFVPALRAIELQGRLLGLWLGDDKPAVPNLAELIAGIARLPDPSPPESKEGA
jgi:hypothetical protein